ncbi:preprotein translocase subunit SecA [Candidatus Microgenomates bacterium]|nr:preprotein translocase subunit SecA [Candidatus Microgenomates bacterium CPR3]RIK50923.1 MAG: preprotein translocase subunit SecA [Candidatus Microgenomates bacterium]
MFNFLTNFFDGNARELSKLKPIVDRVNSLEESIKSLKDKELPGKTAELKTRLKNGESLDTILPEALATIREAIRRVTGERAYDVQLISALSLYNGRISEQKTGEGKTLSATLASYVRALMGQGVHVVTVNDYLARRDAGWYGRAHLLLGLSVGVIYSGMGDQPGELLDLGYTNEAEEEERLKHFRRVPRREAYAADITYGTNNEFGFDYLRDNMVMRLEDKVQRGHYFAIVDEVDSILIDEARTPLIISAPDAEPTDKYREYAAIVKTLIKDTDYDVDEKLKSATLTDYGIRRLEQRLKVKNLYEESYNTVHHIEAALKAETLFTKDKDYVVKDGQVIIVDEHTGRLMYGRRYSDGLHQAIEAKEGVNIQQESRTLATISLQNYFRMYTHLSGMTGTASTEGEEFKKIYNLDVMVIPTHRPVARVDHSDLIFKTARAKYAAIVRDIEEMHKKGTPVLIGTKSIDHNQIISKYLKKKNLPHNVLNAKNHQGEAKIISNAGAYGAITVATNIAGRGVDIVLGGDKTQMDKAEWKKSHEKVVAVGGLHVIGTERHDSRRIDNQLRGRSGRQGDPGSSRFYVSLEDDLMRIFGGEKIAGIMTMLKIPEEEAIEHQMVSKALEGAQVKVEGFYFDMRKRVVEYDDVMNKHRSVIYQLRDRILGEAISEMGLTPRIKELISTELETLVNSRITEGLSVKELDMIVKEFVSIIPFDDASQKQLLKELGKTKDSGLIIKSLQDIANNTYDTRVKNLGDSVSREIEKYVYLTTLDEKWMDHLDAMESLRDGIGLRGYAQRDPLVEYQKEAYTMFERLVGAIESDVVHKIYRLNPVAQPPVNTPKKAVLRKDEVEGGSIKAKVVKAEGSKKSSVKIGRNDPCWCGSGKKWKKCHYPATE